MSIHLFARRGSRVGLRFFLKKVAIVSQHTEQPTKNIYIMSYVKPYNAFCPDMGYCANRNKKERAGFYPVDEMDFDPMEEKLERATY